MWPEGRAIQLNVNQLTRYQLGSKFSLSYYQAVRAQKFSQTFDQTVWAQKFSQSFDQTVRAQKFCQPFDQTATTQKFHHMAFDNYETIFEAKFEEKILFQKSKLLQITWISLYYHNVEFTIHKTDTLLSKLCSTILYLLIDRW